MNSVESYAGRSVPEAITLKEALSILCSTAARTGEELCPPDECLGRVTSRDLFAKTNQPPFRRSAMDGYALASTDTLGAGKDTPVTLPVCGKRFAGDAPTEPLKAGCAMRIMTGAAVPDGADCVIRQEDTDLGEDAVRIFAPCKKGANISLAGEDFAAGDLLCPAGTTVDAYVLSCAGAAGITALPVRKKIRVSLIITGDEVVQTGQPLPPGKIYDSLSLFLARRLEQMGCTVIRLTRVKDDPDRIIEAIECAADNSDLIITTGGISAGQRDLVPDALAALDAGLLFRRIRIKPGMPTTAAVYRKTPVLCLSGNPFSAAAILEILGGSLTHAMLGLQKPAFCETTSPLTSDIIQRGPYSRIMPGYYDGKQLFVFEHQKNAQMRFGIGSNCILILPPGRYSKGEEVTILLSNR